MPSLVSGHIGALRQYHVRVTGMQGGCTRKQILLTSTILNIMDTLQYLVIRISFHFGKQRNGIRINLWNSIKKQEPDTL
jgi:hypothetical protein